MGKPCICCNEQPDVCAFKRNRFDSDKYEPVFFRYVRSKPHTKTEKRTISKIFTLEDGVRTDDPPVSSDSGWVEIKNTQGDVVVSYDNEKFIIKAFEKREEKDTEYGPENFEIITRQEEEEEITTQERYYTVNFVESWLVLFFNIQDMENWHLKDFQGQFRYVSQKLAIFMSDNLEGFEDEETPKIKIHGTFYGEDAPRNLSKVLNLIERSDKQKEIEFKLSTKSDFEEEDAIWIDVGKSEDDEKNWDTLQGNGKYMFIAEPLVGSCELGSHPKSQNFYETKTHSVKRYENIPYVFLEFVRRRGEFQRSNANGELYYDTTLNDEIKKKLLHAGENWHYDFSRVSDTERATYTSSPKYLLDDNYRFYFYPFFQQGFFNNFDSLFNYKIYRPRINNTRRGRMLVYLDVDQYFGESYSTFPDEIGTIANNAVWDKFNYDKAIDDKIIRAFGRNSTVRRINLDDSFDKFYKYAVKNNLPQALYVYPRRIKINDREFVYRELLSSYYKSFYVNYAGGDAQIISEYDRFIDINTLANTPQYGRRDLTSALDPHVYYEEKIWRNVYNSYERSYLNSINNLINNGVDFTLDTSNELYVDSVETLSGWASLTPKERLPYFTHSSGLIGDDELSSFIVKNKKILIKKHTLDPLYEPSVVFHDLVRGNHEEIAGHYTRKSLHNYSSYIVDPESDMSGAVFEFSLDQEFYPPRFMMQDVVAGEENKNCLRSCLDFKDHLPPIKMEITAPFDINNSFQIYSECNSKLITIPTPTQISPTTRTSTMSEYFCYYYDTVHYVQSVSGAGNLSKTNSVDCGLPDSKTTSVSASYDWNDLQSQNLVGVCPLPEGLPVWTLSKSIEVTNQANDCFFFCFDPPQVFDWPDYTHNVDPTLVGTPDVFGAYASLTPVIPKQTDSFFLYKFFTETYDINTDVHVFPLSPGTETEFRLFYDNAPGIETDEVYAVTWSDFRFLRWENRVISAGDSPFTTKQNLDTLRIYYRDEELFGKESVISYSVVWKEDWWKYAETVYWQRGISDSDIAKHIDEFVTETIKLNGQLINITREKKFKEEEIEKIQPNLWDDASIIYKVTDEEPILDDQDNPVEQNGFWKITSDSHEPLTDAKGKIVQNYEVNIYLVPSVAMVTMDVHYFGAVSSYEEHNPAHSLWSRGSEYQIQPRISHVAPAFIGTSSNPHFDRYYVVGLEGREYSKMPKSTNDEVRVLDSALSYSYLRGSSVLDVAALSSLEDPTSFSFNLPFSNAIDFRMGVFFNDRIAARRSNKKVRPNPPGVIVDELAFSGMAGEGYLEIDGSSGFPGLFGVSSDPVNIERQQRSETEKIGQGCQDNPDGPDGPLDPVVADCQLCETREYNFTIDVLSGDLSSRINPFGYSPSHDLYRPEDVQSETNKAFEKSYTQTYPTLRNIIDRDFNCTSRLTWFVEIRTEQIFDRSMDIDVHGGCSVQNFGGGRTGHFADDPLRELDGDVTIEGYLANGSDLIIGGINIKERAFPQIVDIKNREIYKGQYKFFARDHYYSRTWLPITEVRQSEYDDGVNYPDLNLDTSISIWDKNSYLPEHKFDPRILSFMNFIDITREGSKIKTARKDDLFEWHDDFQFNAPATTFGVPAHKARILSPFPEDIDGSYLTSWPYAWEYLGKCATRTTPITRYEINPVSLDFGPYWLKSDYLSSCDNYIAGRSITVPYLFSHFDFILEDPGQPRCWFIDHLFDPFSSINHNALNANTREEIFSRHLGYYHDYPFNPFISRGRADLPNRIKSYRNKYISSRYYNVIMNNLKTILDNNGAAGLDSLSKNPVFYNAKDPEFLRAKFSFKNAVVKVDDISINLSVLEE